MESTLPQKIKKELGRLQVDLSQPFVVAVSGGIDSVVLCELCDHLSLNFTIAHCNFNLRGKESNRDEAFVRTLGTKYNAEVLVQHFDTAAYATEQKLSIQEAARLLRYTWFEEVRKEKGASYVLLAHHANDNVETMLMHFFRGSGFQGLTGIPQRGTYLARSLRPLLPFTRKEIETFAKNEGLTWVEDSSNTGVKYTRNFFRNHLIPQLQTVYPGVEENLMHNIQRFNQTYALYDQLLQKEKEKFLYKKGAEYRVSVKRLMQQRHTSLPYEIIKDFHFSEGAVGELMKLVDSPSGKYMESETHRIIRHQAWFIITPKQQKEGETFILEERVHKLYLPDGVLEIETLDMKHFHLKKLGNIAQLDENGLQFPLIVRRWKAGDYFYPLGMPKKKKLARFFIDQKWSATDKEAAWVLESRGRIVWIIGHRIDDRFKVMPHTRKVVQITWLKDQPK